ncbi:MAG: GNAT family N-acetyltransferase [Chloroflexi bacterium]|nr:GNAT family N-acetyltransferase [Chloroflexota bacterium]
MNAIILPKPVDFPQYTWRPLAAGDAAALHRLAQANWQADGLESAQPVAEIEHMMGLILSGDVQAGTLLAWTEAGEIAASVFASLLPSQTEHRVNVGGSVHAAHRRQGLGHFLMAWAEAWARQQTAEFTDGLPRRLEAGCRGHQADRIKLFEEVGFRPTRYFFQMERDLAKPIPEKPLASGLALANWTPELDEAVRAAFNDSFRDHWGFFLVDETLWPVFTGKPDFRGDLSQLALDGDGRVIGFCLCSVSEERNAQTGKREGVMDEIGVIRGWRKRGIASALIVAAMRAFREAGLEYAKLGVDTENPTGALRLYENLGFYSVRRSIAFHKELR